MNTNKDYYQILEISVDADQDHVKKSYRKLAMIWHPDKHPDKDKATEKFKDISEAYQVLSNVDERKIYDNKRKYGNGISNTFSFNVQDPFEMFNAHFNNDFFKKRDPFKNINQMMEKMRNDTNSMNHVHSTNISSSTGMSSFSSSSSTSISNINGKVVKKTIKSSTRNGETTKEIIEEVNGVITTTTIYPNGTKTVLNNKTGKLIE